MSSTIYTHDEAMLIVEMFEDILSEYNIHIPSPEDDEREPDNMVGLYGYTYSDVNTVGKSSKANSLGQYKLLTHKC